MSGRKTIVSRPATIEMENLAVKETMYTPGGQGAFESALGANMKNRNRLSKVAPVLVGDGNQVGALKTEQGTFVQQQRKTIAKTVGQLAAMAAGVRDMRLKAGAQHPLVQQAQQQLQQLDTRSKPNVGSFMDMNLVASSMEFKSAQGNLSQLDKDQDKLLILGHGNLGEDMLAVDRGAQRSYTAKQVAKQLGDKGLDKGFMDVRLQSCYGAGELQKNLSITGQDTAFGQKLATALHDEGFTDSRVRAYAGAGMTHGAGRDHGYVPARAIEGDTQQVVRSHEASVDFTAKAPQQPTKRKGLLSRFF